MFVLVYIFVVVVVGIEVTRRIYLRYFVQRIKCSPGDDPVTPQVPVTTKAPPRTMTTERDPALDELILQLFEEQEDQFYFPITSQNSARNFVKALHTAKGLAYEDMYREISEFEHNFSAWRKGLGRVGIGNRVMERLNMPLEEILVSDDEEDVSEIISRIRSGSTETRPENDRVPPINAVVNTEETRLIKLEKAIRRQSSSGSSSGSTSGSSSGSEDAKDSSRSDLSKEKEPRRELTEAWRSNIENKIKKLEDERTSPDSPKLKKVQRLPGAELEQRQPGMVDFRSVLKRRSQADTDRKAENRRSMPPLGGSLELAGGAASSLSGSEATLNKAETNGGAKSRQLLKDYTIRAKSEPRILPLEEETGNKSERPKDLALKDKKTEGLDKNGDEFSGEEEFDSVEETVAEIKVKVNTEETKAAPEKTKAPLAAADDEDLTSTSQSVSSKAESSDSESGHSSDSGVNESSSNKDEQDKADLVTLDTGEDEEEDEEEDTVTENYDSDLDETNEDLTREGRTLADTVTKYKTKVQNRDGPGFLFVFKDTCSGKVKVGESRVPKRRLEQASCFNINLELVSALPVSLRKLAVQRSQGRLKRYAVDGHDGWFDGPLDDIIDTVTSTAERYPKNSSEC